MSKNDMFANIAAMGINNENKNLIVPEPIELEEKQLSFKGIDTDAIFKASPKISTREELFKLVEEEKENYRPFFANYAPKMEKIREKRELTKFQWRIGTEQDAKDFLGVLEGKGSWEELELPHFGEPLGVATTYYRTAFSLTNKEIETGSLWISFKGVDYKAHIFLNNHYIGSHEGFFAPFEFEFTKQALEGENILVVMVENDFICMSSVDCFGGEMFTGDKIYGATGLGYDDPLLGWHHCPPGMGIYQDVSIEVRATIFVQDIFVRPLLEDNKAEIWLEVYNTKVSKRDITIDASVFGRNFETIVVEHGTHRFDTGITVGLGDTFTEAKLKGEGKLGTNIKLNMEKGINYLKVLVDMKDYRLWELSKPWLYQVQIGIIGEDGKLVDNKETHFGMRDFRQDEESTPKGKFYLNNKEIRLRGANTMGHEQRCVFEKDWEQLYTDLILAKVCNMNFLRLTQRPVQPEIYDYCDKIGLMIQTDLPHFAAIRRNQLLESVKQAGEMEHLVRNHPSVIMVTYINEPFPNAKDMPHRNLTRVELEQFFQMADVMVHMLNPDRVIKHVDGDYDPPTGGLPDNHCYPGWYNGHGIDIGKLHKGYWMFVKEGWHYGCGEYGIEGLDCAEVMRKYYPKEWLATDEKGCWSANALIGAQTANFHHFFYETPKILEDWVEESQKHQADALKIMTDAYRRDSRMNTFAYHLFIDAYPAGWMKTIMDVDRNPKPAFFAYRNSLKPTMINLRSDRQKACSGETILVEAWICNDTQEKYNGSAIHYQLEEAGEIILAHKESVEIIACQSKFQGFIPFEAPVVEERREYTLKIALIDINAQIIDHDEYVFEVFPIEKLTDKYVCLLGNANEEWREFKENLNCQEIVLDEINKKLVPKSGGYQVCKSSNELVDKSSNELEDKSSNELVCKSSNEFISIIVTDYTVFLKKEQEILEMVRKGANLIFFTLNQGEYKIDNEEIAFRDCGMLPVHFASRDTEHSIVDGLQPDDVKYWYDSRVDYITPFLKTTFDHESYTDILTMGNQDAQGRWQKVSAAGEKKYGDGSIMICQVELMGRTKYNPVAKIIAERILNFRNK